jgi:hypothetical protein
MFILFIYIVGQPKSSMLKNDYKLWNHNYGHIITHNHIYNLVVVIMVVVRKLIVTKVQIWLHDYNQ